MTTRRTKPKQQKNNKKASISSSPPKNLSEKVETKLPKTKVKFKKRAVILLIISVISCLGVILGYRFIVQSVPAYFTSKLTQVGDIELSYGEKQSKKISPLCGCYDVGEWENWRGITFTARNVEIDRKGDMPVTGYLMYAPYPTSMTITPDYFKTHVKSYLVEINESEKFNPEYLISNKFPENYKLLKKEEGDERFIQIFTEGKLKISLLGDKPLGAWIGMENSNLSINFRQGQKVSEPATANIKEKYLKSTEKELNQVWDLDGYWDQTQMSMPVGDFLGPNIVVWDETETTSVLASTQLFHASSKSNSTGKKTVKGFVLNPPFAIRVVAMSFDKDVLYANEEQAPKLEEKKFSFMGSQGRFDSGEVNIKIDNPNNFAKDFEDIYKSMKEKDTVEASFKTNRTSGISGGVMKFKYPPIPPNNGFNIFGKINKLKTTSTTGNLLIGSRSFDIEAPADFELQNINEMEVKNGVMEIPIQVGVDEVPSKIQLKANSEIYINKESITRRIDNNKTLIDYVVLIATIFGVVIAVVSTLIAIKDFTKS